MPWRRSCQIVSTSYLPPPSLKRVEQNLPTIARVVFSLWVTLNYTGGFTIGTRRRDGFTFTISKAGYDISALALFRWDVGLLIFFFLVLISAQLPNNLPLRGGLLFLRCVPSVRTLLLQLSYFRCCCYCVRRLQNASASATELRPAELRSYVP